VELGNGNRKGGFKCAAETIDNFESPRLRQPKRRSPTAKVKGHAMELEDERFAFNK
jgi:hypothetical protein